MKKEDGKHVHIVSADISSESLSGMVIFRPHYINRTGHDAPVATEIGHWFALRPSEVRSFARALLDAADAVDQRTKALQAARPANG
ncbi:MAG: hypothetical protein WA777_09705 [Rhodanobacter sp.]